MGINGRREAFMKILGPDAVDTICSELEDKYGYAELNQAKAHIPQVCWVVYLAFNPYNYAMNEGLARLFNLNIAHDKLSEALQLVGLQDLRRKFDAICEKLGKDRLGDTDKIVELYKSWDKFEKSVSKVFIEFIDAQDSVFAAVGKYCEDNKEELSKYVNYPYT